MTTTYRVQCDGVPIIDKSPIAVLDYIVDLAAEDPGPWLQAGETIASASAVADVGLDVLTCTPAPPDAPSRIVVWLSGGAIGAIHLVTVRFMTSQGREDERAFRVRIVSAGMGASGGSTTNPGQSFAVDNGDGTISIYVRNSGNSAAMRTVATVDAMAAPEGAEMVGSSDDASGTLWTTVAGFISRIRGSFRMQAAGGSVTPGNNLILGYSGNAIAPDIGTATISGGGVAGRENIIGGDGSATVNTATPNVVSTGTQADYSVVSGGYDNVAGGLASMISGFHNYTSIGTSHGTISGGSVQKITVGHYHTIGGGTGNTVSGASYGTVAGGYNNTSSGESATVGGGKSNTASGAQSTVAGGEANTAGGIGSFVGGGFTISLSATAARSDYAGAIGGYQNSIGATAPARFAAVLGGRANNVNAEYSAALGGWQNAITGGGYATALGGYLNAVSATYAATIGGYSCRASGEAAVAQGYGAVAFMPGEHAVASGYFAAVGDAQASTIIARRQTTNATVTELRAGSTLGSRINLSSDSAHVFRILVVARNTGAEENAAYELSGCIAVSAANATALQGSVTKTVLFESVAGWDVDVVADNANKALAINVTGEAGKTINWVADVRLVKVTG